MTECKQMNYGVLHAGTGAEGTSEGGVGKHLCREVSKALIEKRMLEMDVGRISSNLPDELRWERHTRRNSKCKGPKYGNNLSL